MNNGVYKGEEIVLAPEDQWELCPDCGCRVPRFAQMPATLDRDIDEWFKHKGGAAWAMVNLLSKTGLDERVWKPLLYHWPGQMICKTNVPEPLIPCRYCGKILRTARAKQCRFCHADWH